MGNISLLAMKTTPPQHASGKTERAGSTDHVEQLATDVAEDKNRSRVTDQDRKQALDQMKKTATPVPPGTEASH